MLLASDIDVTIVVVDDDDLVTFNVPLLQTIRKDKTITTFSLQCGISLRGTTNSQLLKTHFYK
jgi:hypothetical protein